MINTLTTRPYLSYMFRPKIEGVTVSETFPSCITALHTYFDLLVSIYMHWRYDWRIDGFKSVEQWVKELSGYVANNGYSAMHESGIHELCISYFAKAKVRTELYVSCSFIL